MESNENAAPGTSRVNKVKKKADVAKTRKLQVTAAVENDENAAPGTSGVKKVNKKADAAKTGKALPSADASEGTKAKQTTFDIVCEAIQTVGVSRKGASAQAIKKYVQGKTESNGPRLNALINKALVKGIEKGVLKRPNHKEGNGASGSFLLVKKPAKPKTSKKLGTKNQVEAHASDGENTTPKPPKPRKRHLSDSVLEIPEEMPLEKSTKEKIIKSRFPPPTPRNPNNGTKRKQLKLVARERKDSSDSEIVVEKKRRKSTESHSSDGNSSDSTLPLEKPTKEKIKKAATVKNPKNVTKKKTMKPGGSERKDSSDSEIVVKKKGRKSTKSYSSDTDLDFVQENMPVQGKTTEVTKKRTKTAESKTEKKEPPQKSIKPRARKLFNSSEGPQKEKASRRQTYRIKKQA